METNTRPDSEHAEAQSSVTDVRKPPNSYGVSLIVILRVGEEPSRFALRNRERHTRLATQHLDMRMALKQHANKNHDRVRGAKLVVLTYLVILMM